MKKYLFLLLSCIVLSTYAQENYTPGLVIDSLSVANSNEETYALYLPTSYKSNELSSILIVFSPSGKGKRGIEVFKEAAERYNYILVCSNNSRNGAMNRNLGIAQRLFDHVFSSFAIDQNRIYLGGFSGGSRLAAAIATMSSQIDGVIGCGAGFIPNPSYKPSDKTFSYVGLCGDRDMNFTEMIGTKTFLSKIKFKNTLFSFDGNHEWPPKAEIFMAFEWLEIQALKKGYITKTDDAIKASYLETLVHARSALKNEEPLLAVAHYERSVDTYGSFFNIDSIQQELKNIKKSKDYSSALKSRKKAFEKEHTLSLVFQNRFKNDYEKPEKASLKWWDKEFQKLKKQEVKADTEMIKMFERVRFSIYVLAYTKSNREMANPSQQQKEFCKSLIKRLKQEL